MTAVFFPDRDVVVLGPEDVERLKDLAAAAPLRRARYCLHRSTQEAVQEMIIAFCSDTQVPIHRHRNKSESFHVIEGTLDVVFFDDQGRQCQVIRLGAPGSGLPFFYRLSAQTWHTVRLISPVAVIHETTRGPFIPEETEILKPAERP